MENQSEEQNGAGGEMTTGTDTLAYISDNVLPQLTSLIPSLLPPATDKFVALKTDYFRDFKTQNLNYFPICIWVNGMSENSCVISKEAEATEWSLRKVISE
ncbi:hypothetical protein NPIL_432871 [Nephila pilipes]|uniref:Uncharacterized protein n=1 Tax=Nephila pilipes TaxID=299642 RepID=A0A8X6QEW0_NEPPI|nr:hypothetical protein NPIL_432871 [Nephila pilipes]